MKALIASALAALALAAPAGARAPEAQPALRTSAAVTAVLGVPTYCAPHWRAYLRSIGIYEDTAWVATTTWAGVYEVTQYALSALDCAVVVRSAGYDVWEVGMALYYMAELAAPSDTDRAIARAFYRLRRAFHIRHAVVLPYPEQPPK